MDFPFYSTNNLDHDKPLAIALGNMLVTWARAEQALVQTLACVLNTDNIDMIQVGYYRIPTFEARTKYIRTLMTEWETTEFDKEAMAHIISKLGKLSVTRNGWVHGDWAVNKKHDQTVIFDFRVSHDSPDRRRPVKASDVMNHVNAVRNRTMELDALIGPWLDKYCASEPHQQRRKRHQTPDEAS
jgi:hypothetical protein